MGIYGRWFVATEDEVRSLWRIDSVEGYDPFKREIVQTRRIVLNDSAIESLPNVYEKWLLAHHVAALFDVEGPLPKATPSVEGSECELVVVAHDRLRAFVDANSAPAALASGWRERLRLARGDRFDRFDEAIVGEALAERLRSLAALAVSRAAVLCGTFD